MKRISNERNKFILLLIIFSAGILPAFATDWKGTWNTTFGEIAITSTQTRDITADMGDYILRGNISGDVVNRQGVFSGSYMLKPRLNKPVSRVQHHSVLGSRGQFSFKLSATKQNFNGTYTTSATSREGIWKESKCCQYFNKRAGAIP